MKSQPFLMLYGANGYSAKLILAELLKLGINPILAGRNEHEISELALKHSLDYKIFSTDDDKKIIDALTGIHTILNCAGPFRHTAKDILDACLITGTNYLDITGEMPVLALAFSYNQKAIDKGITFLPSVGFDIIPTDCLAKKLAEQMPDATELKLAFINRRGKISRGTLLTTLEFLGGTGKVRRNGKIIDSIFGEHIINVNNSSLQFNALSIPWGDVFTAYLSTGIPNITVYLGVPKLVVKFMGILKLLLRLFKIPFVKKLSSKLIKKNITGPNELRRSNTETIVYGMVNNAAGKKIEEAYQVMEGYNLTVAGAAESAKRILNGETLPGTFTPSMAFGSGYLEQFIIKKII